MLGPRTRTRSIRPRLWPLGAFCTWIFSLFAAGLAAAGVGTWTPIGPSVDVSIVADRGTNDLYALANDGSLLLRSSDFGASWSVVPPPPIENCHFAFSVVAG